MMDWPSMPSSTATGTVTPVVCVCVGREEWKENKAVDKEEERIDKAMSKVEKGDIELDLVGRLNCAFIQTFLFQQTRIEVENSPIPVKSKEKGRERQRDGICQVATASEPASCY